MTAAEFKKVQETFPWRQVNVGNGNYQMVDRHNNIVDLFKVMAVLEIVTVKLQTTEGEKP